MSAGKGWLSALSWAIELLSRFWSPLKKKRKFVTKQTDDIYPHF